MKDLVFAFMSGPVMTAVALVAATYFIVYGDPKQLTIGLAIFWFFIGLVVGKKGL